MSWMEGVGPVKNIRKLGVKKGLSKDWYSKDQKHTERREEITKGNFWDIIDNPLYEVAAEAKGYNWDDWIKDAKGKVGTGPNDGTLRVRATISRGTPAGTRETRGPGGSTGTRDYPGTPAVYEWMTKDEAEERGLDYDLPKTTRWRHKETGEVVTTLPPLRTFMGKEIGDHDDWEEMRDWGVHDQGVAEDLDEIQSFLGDIVNVNDHLPKIIREGPKGEHYGLPKGTDIWEHYGLDEEPEPPKELEWDSYETKLNLKQAKTSTVTYSTPHMLTPIDLHGDNTPTEVETGVVSTDVTPDRPYADYKGDGDKSDIHPARVEQTEPEFRSKRRWTHNVKEIIGKDQDVAAWSKAAGVNNLNSRNDSDRVKRFFREHDGVLPT